MTIQNGEQRIAAERQRQIEAEGWTAEHDDRLGVEMLMLAALAYVEAQGEGQAPPAVWPMGAEW